MHQATGLFIHMGPGFHCGVEREIFSELRPEIDFWDQPLPVDPDRAFEELTAALVKRVKTLFRKNGERPLVLYAHSVGGLLVLNALPDLNNLVSELHFFSTGFDYSHLFLNLMKKILEKKGGIGDLTQCWAEFLKSNEELNDSNFVECAQLLSQYQDFPRHYWADLTNFEKYSKVASQYPQLDLPSFVGTSLGILKKLDVLRGESPFHGPVEIVLGKNDPLIRLKKEQDVWTKIFPNSKIQIIENCGHFSHFETDRFQSFSW